MTGKATQKITTGNMSFKMTLMSVVQFFIVMPIYSGV